MRLRLFVAVIIIAIGSQVSAQERPFLFSVATDAKATPSVRFDHDVGIGERAFQSDTANQPEQRVGLQASRGRVMFLARLLGIAEVGSSYQSSQSGELLYSILGPGRDVSFAASGGVLHEPGGVKTTTSRTRRGRARSFS